MIGRVGGETVRGGNKEGEWSVLGGWMGRGRVTPDTPPPPPRRLRGWGSRVCISDTVGLQSCAEPRPEEASGLY